MTRASCSRGVDAAAGRLLAQVGRRLAVPEADGFVFSPVSLWAVLAVLRAGATGESLRLLNGILPPQGCEPAPAPAAFRSATSVWLGRGTRLQPGFGVRLQECCRAEVAPLSKPGVDEVNQWAARHTDGQIARLLDQVPPDLRVLIVNAAIFRARWQRPFQAGLTLRQPFHGRGGVSHAEFMQLSAPVAHRLDQRRLVLRLDYADTPVVFQLAMPLNGEDAVAALTELLDGQGPIGQATGEAVTLLMPRFRVASRMMLNSALIGTDLGPLFTGTAGDGLAAMVVNGPVSLDAVRQAAFLRVDEQGTEAAAATSAALVGSLPAARILRVDRPFAFALLDASGGVPLFAGLVRNPERPAT